MKTYFIHRASMDGRPRCGANRGDVSISGACVTCPDCRRIEAPSPEDKAEVIRRIYGAAANYRATVGT